MARVDMVTSFRTIALSEAQAAQTLPLVQVTWPDVDLVRWRKFVRSFATRSASAPAGVWALRDAGDYFCEDLEQQLAAGRR
jgi:hypothetical protein